MAAGLEVVAWVEEVSVQAEAETAPAVEVRVRVVAATAPAAGRWVGMVRAAAAVVAAVRAMAEAATAGAEEAMGTVAEMTEAEGVQEVVALRPGRRWWPWRRPRLRHQPRRPAHRGRRR